MRNNFKNYKKKKLAEEKAIAAERAMKKKKTVVLTVSIVVAVLVIAVAAICVIFAGNNDVKNTENQSTETVSVSSSEKPEVEKPLVYQVVTVRDNDMAPTFSQGDNIAVVSVKSESELEVGDIIYYCDFVTNGKKVYRTLRIRDIIVNEGVYFYEVIGDANEAQEYEVVAFYEIEGKYSHTIPDVNFNDILSGSSVDDSESE